MQGEWIDRQGKHYKIKDMPLSYLKNCIKALTKIMDELIDAVGVSAEFAEEYVRAENKRQELIAEYFKRQGKYKDEGAEMTLDEAIKIVELESKFNNLNDRLLGKGKTNRLGGLI